MRDEESQLGAELAELLRALVDGLDPVVEVERLAAPTVLAIESEPEQVFVVLADVRANGKPPLRGRLDDADVAQAGKRHVERARNRCRREREDVDLEPELPQELFLSDPEALLLIDHHEAEILRDHVAGKHAMCSDEHVDLSLGEVPQNVPHLRGLAEARDHLDPER